MSEAKYIPPLIISQPSVDLQCYKQYYNTKLTEDFVTAVFPLLIL